ncbi:hypothetical protein S7711_03224 [Stachybotrys chartarum IBT 7711]|uniref:DUF6546 domain-containing protein n=1 Tax=Stachybotrys chartarum (strain CBS 109288 / IBT 7711) TaxID=1280523 RepID=A0A084AZJ9_STACB|nr:hypothetical protein S7711_03224 [Stachybotrys chartarum IBT 7711]KFA50948.1 hypothetical protein S40293_02394 [Stachybotrys chartarum IBT 40293]KFA76275.1 hypothetical protein S40288_03582 [Stachybotrys chartarum IBT 40288]
MATNWADLPPEIQRLARLFENALPASVRKLSIFEDFKDELTTVLNSDPQYSQRSDTSPVASLMASKALALRSRQLEHLSIAFMTDAWQFFVHFLTREASYETICTLLRDASVAVRKMPRLDTMVLWNSKQGEASAVIYRRNISTRQSTLIWRGTWDLELSRDVVESWRSVTYDLDDAHPLQIKRERLPNVIIASHGDAAYYLGLPAGVIGPE